LKHPKGTFGGIGKTVNTMVRKDLEKDMPEPMKF